MARARSFPVRGRGSRRQVTWIGPADQSFVSVSTGAKLLVASFDPNTAGLPKPTVVRTRGNVSVVPDATSADVSITGAYGLAIVFD